MIPRPRPIALALLALVACKSPDSDDTELPFVYAKDDVLTLGALQAIGTHNSYHVRPEGFVHPDWDYDHLPLDRQLSEQGVRQFELDLHWTAETGELAVHHISSLDDVTTCTPLQTCLALLKGWSDAHPLHQPIFVLVEPGGESPFEQPAAWIEDLQTALLDVWPVERLMTPGDVQGDDATLAGAVEARGWPVLGEARGKLVMWADVGGEARASWSRDETDVRDRPFFLEADPGSPIAAIGNYNDPIGDAALIRSAAEAGYLVRTMSDPDRDGVEANDRTRTDAALASGAHFVSTDHPAPSDEQAYWLNLPGGTPSRCNPVVAPEGCLSEDIEAPEGL